MQDYEAKRKNLFECLIDAEKIVKGTILDQSVVDNQNAKKRKFKETDDYEKKTTSLEISKFRNKDSIFKRPEIPLEKCLKPRVVPDYQKNPHKWTKYSLEDADISDRMNTTAALQFLKEMESKKEQSEKDCDEDNESKIVFNKRSKSSEVIKDDDVDTEIEDKTKYRGSKLVMPEYDFGKKVKKEKKVLATTSTSLNKTKMVPVLSHLCEDEEDDKSEDEIGT